MHSANANPVVFVSDTLVMKSCIPLKSYFANEAALFVFTPEITISPVDSTKNPQTSLNGSLKFAICVIPAEKNENA